MVVFDNIIFSLQRTGGISMVWYNLLKYALDKELSLQCIEYEGADKNIFRELLRIPANSLEVRNSRLLNIRRYLSPAIKIDVPTIFHSSYYRYCNNHNARIVTTVHDFTYEYYNLGLAKQIHCRQKYEAIKRSDIVVCISENTKRDLLKFLPDTENEKIRVIYNGVSEKYYPIDNHIKELEDYVLFVGARGNYKNFRFVVESLRKTDLKLAICGTPLSVQEKEFVDSTLGSSRYKIFEHIPNEQLNVLYNSVYCLAYPSSYEGFGLPVLEAQRAGCPVIAVNSSSIPEVIGQTPLLIDSLDETEFLEKLYMLQCNATRKKIVESGLINSQRFSWTKMADEYFALYNELLNR